MKTTFLKKYQEYCKSKDSHNDIFKMKQQEEEIIEYYVEHFLYNLQSHGIMHLIRPQSKQSS